LGKNDHILKIETFERIKSTSQLSLELESDSNL